MSRLVDLAQRQLVAALLWLFVAGYAEYRF
jgi:hypothetical protein